MLTTTSPGGFARTLPVLPREEAGNLGGYDAEMVREQFEEYGTEDDGWA